MISFSRRPAEDPAEEAARLLLRLGVFLLFVISLLAPILARQTVYILLPIGAALLLASATLSTSSRAGGSLRALVASPPVWAALLLGAWAGVSLIWTPFEGPAERFAKAAATMAMVAAAAGFMPLRTKTSNLNLLPIGVGVAAVALAAITLLLAPKYSIDDILDVSPLGRAGLGLALLVWPAMGALAVRGRWITAGALGLATYFACIIANAPNALPALLGGAVVFFASFGRVRPASKVLAALMAAIVLAAPAAALATHFIWPEQAPAFFRHLAFWGHMIASDGWRTLLGHGFGSATWSVLQGYLPHATPRSLIFQIWFDLGALGAAALALVIARAALEVGQSRPALAPFLLGGVAAGFVICLLGPAAEQLWWLTLAGLDAIAFALVMRGQFRKRRPVLPIGFGAAQADDAA
ncbi:hypothetical protein [Methylocystis parvus]|uniref:Peptide ABC transporter permease n=1 Tax=Methylocystis parvus TaxID=134 RepID=A0A6B8MC75_9HYPH|nr:hypothetical protein [Methylocystis parvus]QGM98260.1 hypothetical protein F7D14_12755 [Methylocystis parvus]WBK01415.1 hypothetical protein MMG94_06820 [Methylocystis parvus OBBP]